MKAQPIELLAPAKNADIGIEAILHGADAVYIGGPGFGARVDAANTFADIKRLTDFAHRFNARVYMTLNTIVNDEERIEAIELAKLAYENGVDALIVQDMGILDSDLPPIQLHASTQCDVRSPEKARFLESVGFSQVVLAREMNLEQIRQCYETLKTARIEYFIHGALCVSYSGQCYASFAATGRSANRGACAQLCRLPYSVFTEDGRELVHERHVLSLKDNNQSANLEALIDAGVRSFKIEGRLKDVGYVKNITAHYRLLIDEIMQRRPDLCRASDGKSVIDFVPSPEKSFNRGFTDYFTRDRHHDMAVFETPKNAGEKIGKIVRISADALEVATHETLHNADGMTYLTREKTLMGFAVNRAQELEPGRWRLTLRDRPILKKHPQLAPGVILYRNRDQAFEEQLTKSTAKRLIGVSALWQASENCFTLTVRDQRDNCVKVQAQIDLLQQASRPDQNRSNIEKNLRKTGETDYEISTLEINDQGKVVSGDDNWVVDPISGEVLAPDPGDNVIITLDIKLQEAVERILANGIESLKSEDTEGGAAVVIDVRDGGVLAMASYPTFDLTTYTQNYNELLSDPLNPLLNRATREVYPPGSTFKMVTAIGALEEGIIEPDTEILDTGRYRYYDDYQPQCWIYRDSGGARTHNLENVSDAIMDSCNIFFFDAGRRLGISLLEQYTAAFGLGEPTGIELSEETGWMDGPEYTESQGQTWYEGNTLPAAIGQGNSRFTPLQLANYVATLANGGTHYAAHLLKEVKSNDFSQVVERYEPIVLNQLDIDPENLSAVTEGMLRVTTDGSAKAYFADLGVQVAAKTGSAQVSSATESNALFVCFAPYEDPEIALAIVVEKGGSGSLLASIAAEILEYYFSSGSGMETVTTENTLLR